jgi:hypothetical protein
VFVDAFGPRQLERFGSRLAYLGYRQRLQGVLGYTSGALPTVLTGCRPEVHGRMCLFREHRAGDPHILRPLRWMGLLPRALHERRRFRRLAERWLEIRHGISGYVALHKVPPEHFSWLDLPERQDLFEAPEIGGAPTFLHEARQAGLSVYVSPRRVSERQRWREALEALGRVRPDLTFLYAAELDAILHQEGNHGLQAEDAMDRIAENIAQARERLSGDGADLMTLVVGDHGMADIRSTIDPRRAVALLSPLKVFADSTMLRCWGDVPSLRRAKDVLSRQGWPGRWLDQVELQRCHAPTQEAPYGNALFLLDEGVMFAPSFLGGATAGMHGYALSSASCFAALASDRPLPPRCRELSDLAHVVRGALGLDGSSRELRPHFYSGDHLRGSPRNQQ